MKGSSYSLRVMKNAKQYKSSQAANVCGPLLEVPSEHGTGSSTLVSVLLAAE